LGVKPRQTGCDAAPDSRTVEGDLLRIKIQMCPIDLIEPPQQVLGSFVYVVPT
jgi:hypothetical protein